MAVRIPTASIGGTKLVANAHLSLSLFYLGMTPTLGSLNPLTSECEKEPIHIPGRIQPFGVLMTADPDTLVIHNLSENCLKLWDRHSFALLGRGLDEFMSEDAFAELRGYLASPSLEAQPPLRITLAFDEFIKREWEVRAHRQQGMLYLEWEVADSGKAAFNHDEFHVFVRHAVRALQSADNLQALCDKAADQVQQLTGFDRVMVYRFDEDWNGEVISEACRNGMESYLGLHFPASDIPGQARAIFTQNFLRMIPDVDYSPARIHPGKEPERGEPLDLSKATLRSVSPVHIEYLKNMGVKASLTISLIKGEKLWGLIACHHASPLKVNADARMTAEMIGQLISSQLAVKEESELRVQKAALDQIVPSLLTRLENAGDLAQALHADKSHLQAMGAPPGGGVAVCYENQWSMAGKTPSVAEMENLLRWIAEQFPNRSLFHTDCLSRDYPAADAYREAASGLMAMMITRAQHEAVLWFRPEVIASVNWAGEPQKAVRQNDEGISLHPRHSFAAWKQTVTGTAAPWKQIEIDAAERLHSGIIALALKQEYRREQVAKERAERLSREKDEMVTMVSHDLKTPMNVISLSFDFIQRYHPSEAAPVQRMVERGVRAVKMMENLVTNILDVAKIEAGTLDLVLKPENAIELIKESVEMSAPVAQQKGVQLVTVLEPDDGTYKAYCERFRINQVLGNLIGNALKFTPEGGKVNVSVDKGETELQFRVSDTGVGIHPDHLERIFDRYWQAEDTKRLGTGLGLWIAKGIIEIHHGRIWVESEAGAGSTFCFTLPRVHC
jgi:chemotaxis family two-component system sensor kinase Cph1